MGTLMLGIEKFIYCVMNGHSWVVHGYAHLLGKTVIRRTCAKCGWSRQTKVSGYLSLEEVHWFASMKRWRTRQNMAELVRKVSRNIEDCDDKVCHDVIIGLSRLIASHRDNPQKWFHEVIAKLEDIEDANVIGGR